MGDRVRVRAGNGVIQQNLQHLYVGQRVHAAGFELAAHALAVAFVNGHGALLPFARGEKIISEAF